MQNPKYDKNLSLPRVIVNKTINSTSYPNWFNGFVTAKINYGTKCGLFYSQTITVNVNDTPMQIYNEASTSPINLSKHRVTFASVNYCNVTVQVV